MSALNESEIFLLEPEEKEQTGNKALEFSVMTVFILAQINCILQTGTQILFKDA